MDTDNLHKIQVARTQISSATALIYQVQKDLRNVGLHDPANELYLAINLINSSNDEIIDAVSDSIHKDVVKGRNDIYNLFKMVLDKGE